MCPGVHKQFPLVIGDYLVGYVEEESETPWFALQLRVKKFTEAPFFINLANDDFKFITGMLNGYW